MENLNVVNDTQQPAVEAAAGAGAELAANVTKDVTDGSKAEAGKAESRGDVTKAESADEMFTSGIQKAANAKEERPDFDKAKARASTAQSARDNSKFKDFRVREQKLTRELMQYQKVKDALGYKDMTVDDFAAAVISAASGESVEQYKERQEAQQRVEDAEQKLKYYEDMIISQKMESDLREIQKLDGSVKSLAELGNKFSDLISLGWSAGDAYRAVKSAIDRPPETGAVNTAQNIESEFFSSEELDRLTQQQLDDPVIFKKAMKSLKKL